MRLSSVAAAATLACAAQAKKFIMPWMCLEVCDSSASVKAYTSQLLDKSSYFTHLSFESISLEDDGNVHIMSGLTDPSHLTTLVPYPMVITANLTKMRSLFANYKTFAEQIIGLCKTNSWPGINIDFEPDDNGSPADALAYAQFLNVTANELHAAGLHLTVDYDEWNGIWDLNLLAQTNVDYFMSMGTYNWNYTWFERRLNDGIQAFGVDRLVVGLETTTDNNGLNYTAVELQPRFQALAAAGIDKIAIWDFPIPDAFWPFLQAFAQ